ncbi:MAG: glycosyl hydrolase family 17 protein [Myxococcota bacterium]
MPSSVAVGTAEVWDRLAQHPELVTASDVVLAHAHSFWAGVSVDSAVRYAKLAYDTLARVADGREIILGEVGIPTEGLQRDSAIPTVENANRFLLEMSTWAAQTGVRFYYFSAFDELWKFGEPDGVGSHWGIWDQGGVFKSGLQDAFNCMTRQPQLLTCGAGIPALSFDFVPPVGSTADLVGTACHIEPGKVRVAVYIRVSGKWWSKPYASSPSVSVNVEGGWTADVTTGGSDTSATEIAAFMLPADAAVPTALGEASLPPSLEMTALASQKVLRQ